MATPSAARMGGGTKGIPIRRDPGPKQFAHSGSRIGEIVPASFCSVEERDKMALCDIHVGVLTRRRPGAGPDLTIASAETSEHSGGDGGQGQ